MAKMARHQRENERKAAKSENEMKIMVSGGISNGEKENKEKKSAERRRREGHGGMASKINKMASK